MKIIIDLFGIHVVLTGGFACLFVCLVSGIELFVIYLYQKIKDLMKKNDKNVTFPPCPKCGFYSVIKMKIDDKYYLYCPRCGKKTEVKDVK